MSNAEAALLHASSPAVPVASAAELLPAALTTTKGEVLNPELVLLRLARTDDTPQLTMVRPSL